MVDAMCMPLSAAEENLKQTDRHENGDERSEGNLNEKNNDKIEADELDTLVASLPKDRLFWVRKKK